MLIHAIFATRHVRNLRPRAYDTLRIGAALIGLIGVSLALLTTAEAQFPIR